MILVDWQIRQAIAEEEISLTPFDQELMQPASVDLRLDYTFRLFHGDVFLDPRHPSPRDTWTKELRWGQSFVLMAHQFILASTLERVGLGPRHAARIEGKSSVARLGIIVHSTAGFVDPGFQGQLTLEITNLNSMPVILRPGMRIAQLSFMKVERPEKLYGDERLGSHYQGQEGPTAGAEIR